MKNLRRNRPKTFFIWRELKLRFFGILFLNEEYARKTIPFIQPDFFEERTEKIII